MKKTATLAMAAAMALSAGFASVSHAERNDRDDLDRARHHHERAYNDPAVQLGPRPFYLVEGMDEGRLKDRLMQCQEGPFYRTDFSIGHRGAAMQFPEHSDVSYRAGARMGAGIVECDVTFTNDGELVCRHSECDLHTTTNIVATELAQKCTVPPAFDADGKLTNAAGIQCCTSDLSLAEFKTLEAKMDAANRAATTVEAYLGGTASWRTDVYTGQARVLTFRESIELNERLGVKHTPELKGATHQDRLDAIFGSQEGYAQAFIDTLRDAGVRPRDVWAQSFNIEDVLYWIENEPRFGKQAVYLDSIDPTANPPVPELSYRELRKLRRKGVRIIAPPMWALLSVTDRGRIVPSDYAWKLRLSGFDIITWTFERADLRHGAASGGWYYQFDPTGKAIQKDSDMYEALDVLARRVKILGIFSDWPATVTYYANCMGLK
ncbi:MAG: glycerophosphodiester phosphodiesterase [Gammaproteobacteria bacterium]|nr:glycerophosphodiester phosphodiesterase [Gammaproteobacteria bacterium]